MCGKKVGGHFAAFPILTVAQLILDRRGIQIFPDLPTATSN